MILYYCAKCNRPVEVKFGSGKFCSRACANSRVFSDESNEKRRKSNREASLKLDYVKKSYKRNPTKFCAECGKPLSKVNTTGFCKKHIGLSYDYSLKCSNKAKENIASGKMKVWQSRNVTSYPEKFWINVLNNNKITYQREFIVRYSDRANDHYFLDFFLEKNDRKIDLEIDGKQHKYPDRIEHDKLRDERLSALGFEVYRIDWNEVNSEKGKLLMKEKIDKFLLWFQGCSSQTIPTKV